MTYPIVKTLYVNKMKKQKTQKKESHWLKKTIIIAVIIAMLFMAYRGFMEYGEHKYLDGGHDALIELKNNIGETGGVIMQINENESITLAKYNKEATPIIDKVEETSNQTESTNETNSTE